MVGVVDTLACMEGHLRIDPDPFASVWPQLRRAHRRLEEAAPYSPDWAAALAELEEIARTVRTANTTAMEVSYAPRLRIVRPPDTP